MGRTKTKPFLKRKKVLKFYFHFVQQKKCPPFSFNIYLAMWKYNCESLWVHVPFYLHFWRYIQIFGGAISNSSFGGTKKINCIFSTQGRAPCCFYCKYYAELAKTFFFLSDIGSNRKWGSVWPMAFVSVPPFFCNIVYNLSNFVFYTELNARLPIYSHDH